MWIYTGLVFKFVNKVQESRFQNHFDQLNYQFYLLSLSLETNHTPDKLYVLF